MCDKNTKIKEKLVAELSYLNNLIKNHEKRKGTQSDNNNKISAVCNSKISSHSRLTNNVINKTNTNFSQNTYKFVKDNRPTFLKPSTSNYSLTVRNDYLHSNESSNGKHNLLLSNKPYKYVHDKEGNSLIEKNSNRTVIDKSKSKQANHVKLSSSETLCKEIICTTEKLKQKLNIINKVKNCENVSSKSKKNIMSIGKHYKINNVEKSILNVGRISDRSPKCLAQEIATSCNIQNTKADMKKTVLASVIETSSEIECNSKTVSSEVKSLDDVSTLPIHSLNIKNLNCEEVSQDIFKSNVLQLSCNANKQISNSLHLDNSVSLKHDSTLPLIKNIVKKKMIVSKCDKVSATLNCTTPIRNRQKIFSSNLSGNKSSVKRMSAKKNKVVSKYRVVNKASQSEKDTNSVLLAFQQNANNFSLVKCQKKDSTTQLLLDSKYKKVNKKASGLLTYKQMHEKISNSESKSLKKRSVVLSKYKVINRNSSIVNEKIKVLQLSRKKREKSKYKLQNKTPPNTNIPKICKPLSSRKKILMKHKRLINSRFSIVNKKLSPAANTNISKICKPLSSRKKILVKHKRLINSRFSIVNKKLSPAAKPWESPFKISSTVAKRLYKSPIKIINRNISPINQVARMIKTKYLIVNKNKNQHIKPCYMQLFCRKQLPITHFMKYNSYSQHYSFPHKKRNQNFYSKNKRNYKQSPKRTKLLHIRGVPYNATNSKIVKKSRVSTKYVKNKPVQSPVLVIRGVRFAIDPSGKTLRRLSCGNINDSKSPGKIVIGGKTFVRVAADILKEKNMFSKTLASRVLNRSIHTALAASKKDMKKTNKHCIFYNRFGRCNDGIKCHYIHDPSKIAVCTRFLRGTCKIDGCLFSHEVSPGKMALCSFFLLGSCNNEKCPYRHEALTPGTKLCTDFVQGYCSKGKQCKKAHILVCPHYVQGNCEKGSSCAYPHPPQKKRKIERSESENIENKLKDIVEIKEDTDDNDLLEKVSRYFQCDNFTQNLNAEIDDNGPSETNDVSNVVVSKRHKIPTQPSFIPLSIDEEAFN